MRNPASETALTSLDRVLVTRLDLEDANSISPAIDAGIARFGGIDVLVNNAGIALGGPIEEITEADYARMIAVNVTGTAIMSPDAPR